MFILPDFMNSDIDYLTIFCNKCTAPFWIGLSIFIFGSAWICVDFMVIINTQKRSELGSSRAWWIVTNKIIPRARMHLRQNIVFLFSKWSHSLFPCEKTGLFHVHVHVHVHVHLELYVAPFESVWETAATSCMGQDNLFTQTKNIIDGPHSHLV